jgi:hypothetical protein
MLIADNWIERLALSVYANEMRLFSARYVFATSNPLVVNVANQRTSPRNIKNYALHQYLLSFERTPQAMWLLQSSYPDNSNFVRYHNTKTNTANEMIIVDFKSPNVEVRTVERPSIAYPPNLIRNNITAFASDSCRRNVNRHVLKWCRPPSDGRADEHVLHLMIRCMAEFVVDVIGEWEYKALSRRYCNAYFSLLTPQLGVRIVVSCCAAIAQSFVNRIGLHDIGASLSDLRIQGMITTRH